MEAWSLWASGRLACRPVRWRSRPGEVPSQALARSNGRSVDVGGDEGGRGNGDGEQGHPRGKNVEVEDKRVGLVHKLVPMLERSRRRDSPPELVEPDVGWCCKL